MKTTKIRILGIVGMLLLGTVSGYTFLRSDTIVNAEEPQSCEAHYEWCRKSRECGKKKTSEERKTCSESLVYVPLPDKCTPCASRQ